MTESDGCSAIVTGTPSGPSLTSCSCARRSGTWLVASRRTPGAPANKAVAKPATLSARCSQLSSTSNTRRAARAVASASGCAAVAGGRPSAAATVDTSRAASFSGASSAIAVSPTMFCAMCGANSSTSARARLVLPMPAVPTTVTILCFSTAWRRAESSAARPNKGGRCTAMAGPADTAASAADASGASGMGVSAAGAARSTVKR